MAPVKFILVEDRRTNQSQRQHELYLADLKSHAAKVAHARKRQKQYAALRDHNNVIWVHHKPFSSPKTSKDSANAIQDDATDDDNAAITFPPHNSAIGQGKLDPFCPDESRRLPDIMQQCMEYVYETLWPINLPVMGPSPLKSVIRDWRKGAVQEPLQFHAQVSGAATLCLALSTDPTTIRTLTMVRLVHQNKAVRLVQEALRNMNGPPSVPLISCVMDLAVQGSQLAVGQVIQDIPDSPIFIGTNIKLYGKFTTSRAHLIALVSLIKAKGGLSALPVALANLLQNADLVDACRRRAPPIWPLLPSYADPADSQQFTFDVKAHQLLSTLGTGFPLRHDIEPDISLHQQLTKASKLTAAIDQYHRAAPEHLPLNTIITNALVFQHRMLCLPRTQIDEASDIMDVDEYIYEITRITTMIYSSIMLVEVTTWSPVRQPYATALREGIVLCHQYHHDPLTEQERYRALVLWALVLGGLAALGTPDRGWYVTQLSIRISDGLSWSEMHRTMHKFLYWDGVFDLPVTRLWMEACALVWRSQEEEVDFGSWGLHSGVNSLYCYDGELSSDRQSQTTAFTARASTVNVVGR